MGTKIKLYHGSIHKFDTINVSKGKPFKDFGRGFYLSPSRKHSASLAIRNRQIEAMRVGGAKKLKINAYLYIYEFDTAHMKDLKIKNFQQADAEWMKFVVLNRNSSKPQYDYDIVTGPTANDNTRASIQAFFAEVYGDINSDAAVNMLISLIEPHKLPVQYFFGSQKAADLLTFIERVIVE